METMIAKYGVTHPAQSSQFVVSEQYLINKHGQEKGKELWKKICYDKGKSMRASYYIEKYGEEEGLKMWQEKLQNLSKYSESKESTKISSLNLKFKNLLDSLHIEYEMEYCIWLDEIHPKFYDFKIDNFLFELNGDFWHANPKDYNSEDILHFPGGDITAQEIWDKDLKKKQLAESNGFTVVYYWEKQINDNDKWEQITQRMTKYANTKNKVNKESA